MDIRRCATRPKPAIRSASFIRPALKAACSTTIRNSGLIWPLPVSVISDKDKVWTPLSEQETELKQKMTLLRTSRRPLERCLLRKLQNDHG